MELSGNILGGIRAENDLQMLEKAFVETYDFKAITATKDFNFVVGRRGVGKSALFIMASKAIQKARSGYVYKNKPEEFEQLELRHIIESISRDYKTIRSIARIAWKASIFIDQLEKITGKNIHYKFSSDKNSKQILSFLGNHTDLLGKSVFQKTTIIISNISKLETCPQLLPGKIASEYEVKQLKSWVDSILHTIGKNSYYFFDGLDEGWEPNETSTAILGGLALSASEILESASDLHVVLFVRDNMFRSLCYFDGDSSRHIEGNTLRLTWDESSLLHLVANRLRVTLGQQDVESDVKVWNRFASADLKNKDGFRHCLNYTLYRPRDIIVLLNTTFSHVARANRTNLIIEDVENSSKQISHNRLEDLKKEYDTVFPGLSVLIQSFKNKPAFQSYSQIVQQLEEQMDTSSFETEESSDYAILGTGKEAFFALYSIGFLGLEQPQTLVLQFCHDGSPANIDAIDAGQRSCVHPCYWKALDIQSEVLEGNVLIEMYDDNPPNVTDILDQRTKRIGQIISNLPNLKEGKEDSAKFEDWVFQAIKMLFAKRLTNPEIKPNGDAIQRRDIVATNSAEKGFWKRINDDYKARQVIFEVKNFKDLDQDAFRQVLSYSGGRYGDFLIIVYRNDKEGLTDKEKEWVREYWFTHHILVFLLPASMLSRFISKLRTRGRFDYADDQLIKRLDVYERNYLSLRHGKRK